MPTASLSSAEVLQRIQTVIEARLPKNGGDPQQSYVAKLCTKGEDAILKKIGEEATEVVIAGKSHDNKAIVYEVADLWFHSMVLLAYHDIDTQAVLTELARREGLSGLAEFAARTAAKTTQGE